MVPAFAATRAANPQVADVPATRLGLTIKRAFDFAVAAVLLLLAAPIITVLAFLVKLHDRGPAFYRRRVVGRDGQFDAFKLRTMRVDADEQLGRDPDLRRRYEIRFKLEEDPRVTTLGRLLRRTSLDELPQLWNVLRGEMSLVGPRMISPPELERYGDAAWIFRHVRPGLTGHWQVSGGPQSDYQDRVAMDLHYVKSWSLGFDLKILLLTPWRLLRGSRAC